MWELGFKFQFQFKLLLSLLLVLNCLDKIERTQGFNSDWNSASDSDAVSDRGFDWDWFQTGRLGMVQGGPWLRPSLCPDSSFVTGYQMKFGQRGDNSTGEITGFRLNCSALDQNYNFKHVDTLQANGASFSSPSQNSLSVTANRQAVGFSMARWINSEDFEFVGGWRLKFYGEAENRKSKSKSISRFRFPKTTKETLLVSVGCPEGWAICGIQGRENLPHVQEAEDVDIEDGGPIRILTQLRFKCCYYCIPQERRVILDDYTNPGSTDYTRTIRRTVGTQIDRRNSSTRSNSRSSEKTRESQKGNSHILTTSQSESEGTVNSTNEGESDSKGWNTGEEFRISTSSQNTRDSRTSTSESKSETKTRSFTRSATKIASKVLSLVVGETASKAFETAVEVTASIGATIWGIGASAASTLSTKYGTQTSSNKETTSSSTGTQEMRETEENTHTTQTGTTKEKSSGTSHTDTNGKETTSTKGKHGSTSLSKEKSQQRSIQRAKDQSIQKGAQAMFTQRQGDQQSWEFNWEQSDSSMWREEREDTQTFTCEAMHRCKIEQIYGTCGALQISTPKIEKKIQLLKYGKYGGNPEPETVANKTKEVHWAINIPGEIWIVVKDISHWEPSGHWQNVQVCPPDTIVTGHMFQYLFRAGIRGIALVCSGKYGRDEGEKEHNSADVHILRISSEDQVGRNKSRTRGRWGVLKRGSRAIFAEGYSFARREMHGVRSIGNQEIIYHNISLLGIPKSSAVNSSRIVTACPPDHAICGLTAMMDKAGVGILTGIGLKCCHHCIPEEKWVQVHDYTNRGSSEERKEVTTTVGLTRSHTNMSSNSVNSGSTTDSAGISRSGLHAGFSARFGTSSSTGFDWTHTKNSIWNDETVVKETYVCEPFSSCVYRRLVGQCGSVRVPVGKFEKISNRLPEYGPDPNLPPVSSTTLSPDTTTEATPSRPSGPSSRPPHVYPNQYNLEDEMTPVQVLKNGEIWIEAQNIQISNPGQNTNANNIWGKSESCPLGSFVTGYKLEKMGGEDENTKELLNGLELQCSKWDARGKFQQVKMIPGGQSGPSASDQVGDVHVVQTDSPAVGFHLFVYEWFDEDWQLLGQGTTGHALIFDRWSTPESPSFDDYEYDMNTFEEKVFCPTDYVICGVRTKKDGSTGVLTDVRFQCCYHCEPSEREVDLDQLENPTDVTVTHTIQHVSVGALVERKNPVLNGSAPNTFTLLKGFSDYNYMKEMFSHRLPKGSTRQAGPRQPQVDWSRQPKSVWTKELEITKVYSCKAHHRCVVTQTVGKCGTFEILTSVIANQDTLIRAHEEEEQEEEQQQQEEGGS